MFKCCVCNKSSRKEKLLVNDDNNLIGNNKSMGNKVGDSSIKTEDEMMRDVKTEKARNGEVQRCERAGVEGAEATTETATSSLLENHVVCSEKLTTGGCDGDDEKMMGKVVETAERIEKDEGGMLEHEKKKEKGEEEKEERNREGEGKGGTIKGVVGKVVDKAEEEEGGGGIGGVETTTTTTTTIPPSSATTGSIKVVVKSNLYNSLAYIERTIDDGPEEEGDDSVFESCPNENENENDKEKEETTGKATTTVSAIPRWLSEEDDGDPGSEGCSGMQEPPATPVARDELALRRHRFFSDLLQATQNTSEYRVRFDPLGPMVHAGCEANDREEHLEDLVNRLENVTKRLERVPGRSAAVAQTQETAVQTNTPSPKKPQQQQQRQSASTRNTTEETSPLSTPERASTLGVWSINGNDKMSVAGYEDLLAGSLKEYLRLSQKIGGDVATHSEMVEKAFQIQLGFIQLAASRSAPTNQSERMSLLAPTSAQMQQIQEFSEKNRNSAFFNHLAAISGSIPALGWVAVSPTPAPYVKEMNDAGQFYTNRVLKDWKEKDKTHVDWCKAWVQTLTDLQQYVRQHHTTGLVWAKSGGSAPVGIPPPPPPSMPLPDVSALNVSDDRSALFAEINQGEGITKNLKKVTSDMQTHKNPSLRTGPAPFKAPVFGNAVPAKSVPPANVPIDKPPVFTKDGKKWLVEYHKGNKDLLVDNVEMNNVVYMFRCQDSTMVVKGKVNSIVMDSCRKSSIVFDSVVSSIEFVNCQSVQMQVLGKVPTISIDKTDGCQMYLNSESLDVELITSKSSEMNVMVPKGNGDYTEYPVPEQFKTTISPKGLSTIAVDSLG